MRLASDGPRPLEPGLLDQESNHQTARLVAVEGGAESQIAEALQRTGHGAGDGGLQQRAVLVHQVRP